MVDAWEELESMVRLLLQRDPRLIDDWIESGYPQNDRSVARFDRPALERVRCGYETSVLPDVAGTS